MRLRDAEVLPGQRRWSGAHYLCGYAVECALKACIAKRTARHEFPDREFVLKIYTHDVQALVKLAGLQAQLDDEIRAGRIPSDAWAVVKEWSEDSRYADHTGPEASALFDAIANPVNGVFQWIERNW